MRTFLLVALTLLTTGLVTPPTVAQFLYLRPEKDETKTVALVFYSDPFTETVPPSGALAVRTITAVENGGKRTQLVLNKEDTTGMVVSSAGTLFTSHDYGVSNRGEGNLLLLRYHAKCQVTDGIAVDLPLELLTKKVDGGVAFVAIADGKPVGNTTVTIHEPGETEPRSVPTDADGSTATYSMRGRYAARVGRFIKAEGEHEGRRYTGIWEYSTLVTDVK